MEHISARPRRVGTPLLTLLAVAAIAAGVATGLQSLQSAANAGAIAAAPASSPAINDPASTASGSGGGIVTKDANSVSNPRPTPVVAAQACQAMDAAANRMYCGSPRAAHVTAPRAAWQACEAMDVTAYGQYCRLGDGGRWIEGPVRTRR